MLKPHEVGVKNLPFERLGKQHGFYWEREERQEEVHPERRQEEADRPGD